MSKNRKMIQFGAGGIGRSFLGQLFSRSGYEVVFVDINKEIVKELNRKKEYPIIIKQNNIPDKKILVSNVRAIEASNTETIIHEIVDADNLCTAVGKDALGNIIPLIARGLLLRGKKPDNLPLDIIIAENMRHVSWYFFQELKKTLPEEFPLNQLVGLVETSIGKMVPIIPEKEKKRDPLILFAEPYNQLIVDRKGFKNPIPPLPELLTVDNIQAYVDRKCFIHNLGHTATAYLGYQHQPGFKYIYESLQEKKIYNIVRRVMLQSAQGLNKTYPDDLRMNDLEMHIEDLLTRFQNRALGDTIYRVGRDLYRKLDKNERIIGPMMMAEQHHICWDELKKVFNAALQFKAKDEYGKLFPADKMFIEKELSLGIEHILLSVAHIDLSDRIEAKVFRKLTEHSSSYHSFRRI